MRLWRLTRTEFIPGLDGEGANLLGGTWNTAGRPVVYLSSSLALATLEVLVNLPVSQRKRGMFPAYTAIAVDIGSDAIDDPGLPDRQDVAASRAFGDPWLRSASSLGLSVPSRVIPLERNVLLNPRHPAMSEVSVAISEPFVFDDRLSY